MHTGLCRLTDFIRREWVLILFLIISPGFWWIFFQPVSVWKEWSQVPQYYEQKRESIVDSQRLNRIKELRWAQVESGGMEYWFSKVVYNRQLIVVDEFFGYVSFLSPRIYFQAGDGTKFSPDNVEPIPVLLFPFWVVGLLQKGKEKRKMLLGLLVFTLAVYLGGNRNMAFLWPVMLGYVCIASWGFKEVMRRSEKWRRLVLMIIIIYGLYVEGRMIGMS